MILKTTIRIADFMLDSFHGMCMAINRTQIFYSLMFLSFGTINHSVCGSRMMGTSTNTTYPTIGAWSCCYNAGFESTKEQKH